MILRKSFDIQLKEFYKDFLYHSNYILPSNRKITEREREVLAEFWSLEGDLVQVERFNTTSKKVVRERLNFNGYTGLENILRSLLAKGFLVKKDEILSINKLWDLPKETKKAVIEFTFNVTR